MNRWILPLALLAGAFTYSPLEAQRGAVPPGYEPPPGMCRVWLDGVPPGRQPAPTDCPTAIRRKPANAQVIFGPRPEQPPATPLDQRRQEPQRDDPPPRAAPERNPRRGAEPVPRRGGEADPRRTAEPETRRGRQPGRVIERRDPRDDD